ncbi:MAG: PaaI family thioesterase [Nitratireductor sp.]
MAMTADEKPKHPAEIFFSSNHPISSYVSVRFVGVENHVLTIALEAPAAFVDNEVTGEVHSGLATLILDTVLGGAVMGEMEKIQPIATVGLTTQHMRRAVKGEPLLCRARFEGIHRDMAHMSGMLVNADTGETLSTATGTFMLGTRSKPLGARL